MEMVQIQVPMTPNGAVLLRALADKLPALASGGAQAAAPVLADGAPAPAAAKRGRPPKAATTEAAPPTPPTADDLGDELGLDPTPPAQALTLEGDVIPAFRKFIEKNKGDKSKAAAVLQSYGLKSVQDLKPEQFADVMAKLK